MNWILNDSLPVDIAQEFEPPALEQSWLLQDSLPVTVGQSFAMPPEPWSVNYYGGASSMLFEVMVIRVPYNQMWFQQFIAQ